MERPAPKPIILSEEKYKEIKREWERLPKYTKQELKDKLRSYSRVTFSFDEQIGKQYLVCSIMAYTYGGGYLDAYQKMYEAEKKALRAAKRAERRKLRKV